MLIFTKVYLPLDDITATLAAEAGHCFKNRNVNLVVLILVAVRIEFLSIVVDLTRARLVVLDGVTVGHKFM